MKFKKYFKKFIIFFLFYTGLLSLVIRFAYKLRKNKNIPVIILLYHRITEDLNKEINQNQTINHPLGNFTAEVKFLKRNFNIVPLDKLIFFLNNNIIPNKPTLAITFDDGYEDNFRLAYPILKRFDIPATIYLTAGLIGTNELPWDETLAEIILHTGKKEVYLGSCFGNKKYVLNTFNDKQRAFADLFKVVKSLPGEEHDKAIESISTELGKPDQYTKRLLNWDEISKMKDLITFGAHTVTHPVLSGLPIDTAKKEIINSKKIIEEKVGKKVEHFAFPFGFSEDFSLELKEYCRKIGFSSVATAIYGANFLNSDVFYLNRLSPGDRISSFAYYLTKKIMFGN